MFLTPWRPQRDNHSEEAGEVLTLVSELHRPGGQDGFRDGSGDYAGPSMSVQAALGPRAPPSVWFPGDGGPLSAGDAPLSTSCSLLFFLEMPSQK